MDGTGRAGLNIAKELESDCFLEVLSSGRDMTAVDVLGELELFIGFWTVNSSLAFSRWRKCETLDSRCGMRRINLNFAVYYCTLDYGPSIKNLLCITLAFSTRG